MRTVALIGPESTGKSTLARELACRTGGICIPEYARTYVEGLHRPYTKEDVLSIARHQVEELSEAESDAPFRFLDTDLIVTKVWLLDKYGECPDWLEEAMREKKPDLYLVCCPDLPFVEDPVRENGKRREELLRWYVEEIENLHVPYSYISGTGENRIQNALQTLQNISPPQTVMKRV